MPRIRVGGVGIAFGSDIGDEYLRRKRERDLRESEAAAAIEAGGAAMTGEASPEPALTPTTAPPRAPKPVSRPPAPNVDAVISEALPNLAASMPPGFQGAPPPPEPVLRAPRPGEDGYESPKSAFEDTTISEDRRSMLTRIKDYVATEGHAAWTGSIAGMASRHQMPFEDGGMLGAAGSMVLDLPIYAAASVPGLIAAGPVGAGVSSFAITDSIRAGIVWDILNNPENKPLTLEQEVDRASAMFGAMGKGAAIGGALGVAGRFLSPVARKFGDQVFKEIAKPGAQATARLAAGAAETGLKVAGEAGALVGAQGMVEGKAPTAKDLLQAVVLVGAFRGPDFIRDHGDAVGAALLETYRRTGLDFPAIVRNANAMESLYGAADAGVISRRTASIGARLLRRSPDFDENSAYMLSDAVRMATDEEMAGEGFQPGTRGRVLGVTETRAAEDGNLETAIGLYRGHDERTLVHEWYHRYWDRLSPEHQAAYEEYHAASGREGSAKEAFATEGTDFFFDEGLSSRFPNAVEMFRTVKRGLLKLAGRVDESPGAQMPQHIRAMYQEAGHVGTPGGGRGQEAANDINAFPGTETYANNEGHTPEVGNKSFQVVPETPEFKAWFGDSKVVDEQGKPLVVYRGSTERKVETINPRKAIEVRGAAFFTDNADVAEQYRYEREYGEIVGDRPGALSQTYLAMSNPLEVDMGGAVGDAIVLGRLVNEAKAGGHDGLILRNIDDTVDSSGQLGTTYAIFNSNQVKSIFNRGTWDPNDSRISFKVEPVPEPLLVVEPSKGGHLAQLAVADDLRPITDTHAININFARLSTGDDVHRLINETATLFEPQMQAARRGTVSHEETLKEAQGLLAGDLGVTPGELLAGWRRGRAPTAAEATAIRILLVKSGEHVMELSYMAAADPGNLTLRFEHRRAVEQHVAIQTVAHGAAAEAGRALNAFNIAARSDTYRAIDMRAVLDQFGSGPELAQAFVDIANSYPEGKPNVQAVAAAARAAAKPGWWDLATEVRINGMLSGPLTHVANITGNIVVAGMTPIEMAIASGFGLVRKGIASIRGTEADPAVTFGETHAYTTGLVGSLGESLVMAGRAWRAGQADPAMRGGKAEAHPGVLSGRFMQEHLPGPLGSPTAWNGPLGRAFDYLGEAVRLPGRALTAEDEFFFAMNYRAQLHADAYTTALSEGLTPGSPDFSTRHAELLQNPTDAMVDRARDSARMATFTQDIESEFMQRMASVARTPIGRVVMPFVRTPVNIAKYAFRRTPLAIFDPAVRRDIRGGGRAGDLALARMALGSVLLGAAVAMAGTGYVTGGGPSHPGQRRVWMDAGYQPYSVRIGDTWYSYNRIEPVGMLLGLGADAYSTMAQWRGEDEGLYDLAMALASSMVTTLASKTWLQGVSESLAAINDMQNAAPAYARSMAASFLPFSSALRTAERIVDPTSRRANSIIEAFQAQIPVWGSGLFPRRNIWGEPMRPEYMPAALNGWLLPIQKRTMKHDPVSDEMLRLGMSVSAPDSAFNIGNQRIELTPEEYDRFQVLAAQQAMPMRYSGLDLHAALDQLITSPQYLEDVDDPRAGKAARIHNVISDFRGSWDSARKRFTPGSAKDLLIQEFPRLQQVVIEEGGLF